MANSYVEFTGNGSTTTYAIPFGFISSSHVTATVNGVATAITISSGNAVFGSAPASSSKIRISRNSSQTTRLVDYTQPSTLTEEDLDTDSLQAFYISQEAVDTASDSIQRDLADLQWTAASKRIKNVTNPTADQDAVTKHYLENTFLSPTDKTNLTTVAGISANVSTVAGIAANVTAVAADASDIGTVAGKATEIGRLGTADAVADMAILATTDVVADMNTLATADIVSDMNTLGTADVVADMNALAVADVIADMNTLAVADVIADMNTLGTADVVSDLNTLGTADAVSDMNTLAAIASDITSVAADATDIGAVAGKATEIGRLGTADAVADLAILGTADVVTDMNVLATADVVSDMNTLATADIVSDMNTLGTSANVTNMATVAANITGVNSFADRYRVESSDPASSLDEGDLVFNTTSNLLKYYNGSAWVTVSAPDVTAAEATATSVAMAVALG
tara:strand:+ start:1071 stop:2438 length:1368 start_codon:yes stop_codon:yes gene_type:complete